MLRKTIAITILAAALLAAAGWAQESTWTSTVLSAASSGPDRNADIALDEAGEPWIAYSSSSTIWLSGPGLFTSRATGPNTGYCAMARGTDGVIHVATQAVASSSTDFFLMYLSYENGFWGLLEYPDLPDFAAGDTLTGGRPDIAVDQDGRPWISYEVRDGVTAGSQGDLRVAWKDGSQWIVEEVDAGPGDVGNYSSIAIDPQGRPRVAYRDAGNGQLKVARRTAVGAWVLEVVDSDGDPGWWADIAVDSSGLPHISYVESISGAVRYATREVGGAWVVQDVPDISSPDATGTAIAVDDQGDVHIAFRNETADRFRYATLSAGTWNGEVISDTPGHGSRPSLALADDATPHVVFSNSPSLEVWYATRPYASAAPVVVPVVAARLQVWPNPVDAGAQVRIGAALDEHGKDLFGEATETRIYDVAGRLVHTLPPAADGEVTWDGRGGDGRALPGGVYLAQRRIGGREATGRIVLLP
jgi:hypothetical protein